MSEDVSLPVRGDEPFATMLAVILKEISPPRAVDEPLPLREVPPPVHSPTSRVRG